MSSTRLPAEGKFHSCRSTSWAGTGTTLCFAITRGFSSATRTRPPCGNVRVKSPSNESRPRRAGNMRGIFFMMEPTVALVYGSVAPGASEDEQDVLVQVRTVRDALASLGRRTVDVPVTLDLASAA